MSDSIPNASIAVASSNPKDFSKKKRANRTAKLKQCKLDVRREQWLSQVKTKGDGCKEEVVGEGSIARKGHSLHSENREAGPVKKLEIKTRSDGEIYGDGTSMHHHYSDSESFPSNSPTSHTSSVLGSNDSGVNFSVSSRSSSRSSSSSSHGYCSGHMSYDEDGGDNGAGDDDWEAVADALEEKHKKLQDCTPTAPKHGNVAEIDLSKANSKSGAKQGGHMVNCCAWRPDDVYRPQNLPNLSKQYSFPLNSQHQLGQDSVWECKDIGSEPTSCPICFDDFDSTDSSFFPCSCGFRICLFCHKTILEVDGRCPCCRKKYECKPVEGETTLDGGSLTFRLARSCSMITRS